MKKTFILFGLCLFVVSSLYSQRNCGSMDYLQEQINANPQIQQNMDRLEIFTQNYIEQVQGKELNNGVITIPVIVHVLYQNSSENISDNQIASQIDVLNEDFRRQNADASDTPSDFLPVAADTEIEFCLIQTVRVSTTVGSFGTNNSVKFSSSGGSDVITPGQAMNMWVCEIGGGILGYAQFPGGSSSTDGIVIDYRYFGTQGTATPPFNLGRTATHEVGHYLNLRHIWGDGGCNVDDQVNDTPLAGGPNYTGSPCSYPGPNSCVPRGRPGQPDDFDMFQNYMDYSDDVCMNLFTQGQKGRMMAALNGSRSGLISASCTGTPVEICDNNIDDDGDGQVDCADGDCASDPACGAPVEICDNNIDDDGDGQVDCADGDCASDPSCQPPGTCEVPSNLAHERRKGGKEGALSWNVANGALSYNVEVFNASGALHASGTVTSNGAIVGGLTKNAAYTWRVRSNCAGGVQSAWADGSFNARLDNSFVTSDISVFPNPTNLDRVMVDWDLNSVSGSGIFEMNTQTAEASAAIIQIIDMTGKTQIQLQAQKGNNQMPIDISSLSAGVYIIQVSNAEGYSLSTKLVKLK